MLLFMNLKFHKKLVKIFHKTRVTQKKKKKKNDRILGPVLVHVFKN